MIVGERFVWSHLPKTGGDATAAMLAAVPRLVVQCDDPRSQRKHQTIEARLAEGLDLSGRVTVCNIRRLPAWVLSSARHQQREYGLEPDWSLLRSGVVTSHAPRPLDRFVPRPLRPILYRRHRPVERVAADEVLARHTAMPIDHWLRQEHLADDLVGVLRLVADLDAAEEATIRRVPAVNSGGPAPEVGSVFGPDDLVAMYARNPRWASLEQRLYGATMVG